MKYGVAHVSHIFVSQVSQDSTIFNQQYVKQMYENTEYVVSEHMLAVVPVRESSYNHLYCK